MTPDFSKILPDLKDPESVYKCYEWVKRSGLLLENRICESCSKPLRMGPSDKYLTSEGVKCVNVRCMKPQIEISSLERSFFNPKYKTLTLPCWLHLINFWCIQKPARQAASEIEINQNIVKKVYECCQKFVAKFLDSFPLKLDQKFVLVKKYDLKFRNYGSYGEFWFLMMVGIVSTESKEKNVGYMQRIDSNTSNDYLISIIEDVVKPNSVIISDEFGKKPDVNSNKLTFLTCDSNFDGILETYHNAHSGTFSKIEKAQQGNGEIYLKECVWRERARGNLYECFMDDLKTFYNSK